MFLDRHDHIHLVTDPTLVIFNAESRSQGVLPSQSVVMRRDAQGVVRPCRGMLPAQVQHMPALQNSTPLAIPQHLKKMQPTPAQMRISSGGGMRPPTVSVIHNTNNRRHPSRSSPN